jgi:molybdenum cofactor cytidylyltransferase
VPTVQGKRGNPVLFARRFFAEMESVSGDVGARHLIGESPELVREVDMADGGVLLDIDTPQALEQVRDRARR